MTAGSLLLQRDARGIATLTFNRPERGNAYDGALLAALVEALQGLAVDTALRALVLRGAGRHFQCGADLHWMAEVAAAPLERGQEASRASVEAFRLLNEFPRPTLALVQGACLGGGCGFLCCADVALAAPEAVFSLAEVKAGVAPTPISTQLVHAIGARQARRYALTGERFDATEALRIGLVHEVVPVDAMEARAEALICEILEAAPQAVVVTKASLLGANDLSLDAERASTLADDSWRQRASAEGREGLAAFREGRLPSWTR